jgi:hypothetical protein
MRYQAPANPLRTRADLQEALCSLIAPLDAHVSPGGARVFLGASGANQDSHTVELEGFSRPLWGLIPFAMGGGEFDNWERYRSGLANGTNPEHPEYWGEPRNLDQRLVEMAAIGFSLLAIPHIIWDPLSAEAKEHVAHWLGTCNQRTLQQNTWLFIRVFINLGLANVGANYDPDILEADLQVLDTFYLGNGWYSDGQSMQRDYYISFGMHFYSLLYAKMFGLYDMERADAFRERAKLFVNNFIYWFDAQGAALPFGRSMTYRFAQGSFWCALAFADVESLPWGVIKGLALRHIRWWLQQPIFNSDGTLSLGYGYPNTTMVEQFNSPGSPYWATKFFLLLALDEEHPFWQAEEEPLPNDLPDTQLQPHAHMLVYREAAGRQVIALTSGQFAANVRHGNEKYSKFAYSSNFAFSIPIGMRGLSELAPDSMLALSDDGDYFRVRGTVSETNVIHGALHSRWHPMMGVEVETWLIAAPPWHMRIHCLRTTRYLWSAEGGFALDRTGDDPIAQLGRHEEGLGSVLADYPAGVSAIRDLLTLREGVVLRTDPNTNILRPRTVLPMLQGQFVPGTHWIACAVLASIDHEYAHLHWKRPPRLPEWAVIMMT